MRPGSHRSAVLVCALLLGALHVFDVSLASAQLPPASEQPSTDAAPPPTQLAPAPPAPPLMLTPTQAPAPPAAELAPPPAAPAPVGAQVEIVATTSAPGPSPSLAGEPSRAPERAQNTLLGPVGGIQVVDATSGEAQSLRLQLAFEGFVSDDFLIAGDRNGYFGGTLSLGYSVFEQLELFGSLHSHANGNDRELPQLMQVLGDTLFGAKGHAVLTPWLFLGGDLRLQFYNSIGDVGPVLGSTSIGLRGLLSADFRALPEQPFPLIARASLGYFFDNSALLADQVEDERYAALGASRRPRPAEDRHLLRRVERFALSVQRVDNFEIGLGTELPLKLEEQWFLHPMLEVDLAVPVNRQGYECLLTARNDGPEDPDGCLGKEGLAAMPASLTLGARLFPPVYGLSTLLGFEIGLSGTSTFVRELPGNRPWALLFTLGYSPATSPKTVLETREVVREVVRRPPEGPRIEGVVLDASTGAPIAFARVEYVGQVLTAQSTGTDGRFLSYELLPGEAQLMLSHPDYEPGVCNVVLSAERPAPSAQPGSPNLQGELGTNPYLYGQTHGEGPSPNAQDAVRVPLRCELVPRPKLGSLSGTVVGANGEPIAGAQVMLTGPSPQTLITDAAGGFSAPSVVAGSYALRVDSPAHLLGVATAEVLVGGVASVRVQLELRPKVSQVVLTEKEVRIKQQVFFRHNSAELSERSTALLHEVADVILRNPQIKRIEVQGHTDNVGDSSHNLMLSQDRSEAVRASLIASGVSSDLLTAKGYGDTRPLVPNLTNANRAKNRRVQFVIP